MREYLFPKGVVVDAVLFRDIPLPAVVTIAVVQTKERQEPLEREKTQLKIVAQQQVHKMLAESITCELVRYNSIERWDGRYPTTMMGGGKGVLLSLPNNQ